MPVVTIQQILDFSATLQLRSVSGPDADLGLPIRAGKSFSMATGEEIAFLQFKHAPDPLHCLRDSQTNLLVLEDNFAEFATPEMFPTKSFIFSADPKGTMATLLRHFFFRAVAHSIHPTAIVSSSATLGDNVHIGPYTVIEDNVEIGEGTYIGAHVHVQSNCRIGRNVVIRSNTVIGNAGFGLIKNEEGVYLDFPHFGAVVIGNDVRIGSSVCIDRGSLNDTILHDGVKVDNLVHIAHNVEVGKNTLIIANAMIGGSTKIGSGCWIAPSVSLRNNIVIGDDTVVGLGSVVTRSFYDEAEIAGVPARKLEELKALLGHFKAVVSS